MSRIFITGSTDGLGRAAARALLNDGHQVVQKRTLGTSGLGAQGIHLQVDDLREIYRAAAQIEVQGARYPGPLLKMVGR